jgi:hypothetical protein
MGRAVYGPIRTVVQELAGRLPPYADQVIKYPVLKLPQRPKIQIQLHHCRRQRFPTNTNRVSVGNQKLSFF